MGKTQAGKSSIIHAITGSSHVEIGNGFRNCTRTARLFDFPNPEECFLRFFDTRGLGEAGYDPAEDLAFCQDKAHLVMAVVRAMDHAQSEVQDALRKIRKAKPNCPVILVQTAHPIAIVVVRVIRFPTRLRLSHGPKPSRATSAVLAHQRQEFAALASHFVAVDFTLPEDGFSPELYGLESLWSAIEVVLPFGLRKMLRQDRELRGGLSDIYYRAAWPHIMSYSVVAGVAGRVSVH